MSVVLGRPTECVGRVQELALLEATFGQCVEDGSAKVVLVVGALGMGKTRLAHEFALRVERTDDAPLVRARLGESLTHSGWQIVEDVTLSRGGCRLECPAGDIDGSVEHRWQRLMETLGQNGNWIKSIPE